MMKFFVICFTLLLFTGAIGKAADPKAITWNVIATNRQGDPVTDLQAGDLRIVDGKSAQPVTVLNAPSTGKNPPPVVILFDLAELSFDQRQVIVRALKESLGNLPSSVPAYLYILQESGRVRPVIPVTGAPVAIGGTAGPKVGEVLDKALETEHLTRTTDMKVLSLRTTEVYSALDAMNVELGRLAGRKQLLWITYGIPANIHMQLLGWVDVAPKLREMGARFNASNTAIYTVDPGLALALLNRDGLSILSGATGGRTFNTSDLSVAFSQMLKDDLASYGMQFMPAPAKGGKESYRPVKVVCERKDVKLVTPQVYLTNAEK